MRAIVYLLAVPLALGVGPRGWGAEADKNERTGLAAITVPAGFSVEVAVGAPLVERPMLATFDDRGRMYVADSAGVNLRGPELSKNPPHFIRLLEDTDGDGCFDKSTVFADKMVFPQGVVWHDGAVYCSSPPSFWRLEDTDGDGVADKREELVTGFANTGVADDMHGGSLGPDGRIYWCAGRFPHKIQRPGGPVVHEGTAPLVLRCRPDGSDLEVVSGSQGNAVGVAFSPRGDMFASGTFLAPNSMGAGLRDALVHCVDGAEYPVRDRTLNEHKRTGDLLPPLTHLGVAAASDLMICRADGLGDDARGNLFSALFNMHKIMRHRLEPAGATFKCRNEDFLVSSDPDFHPTDVFEDADGSMLVIDTGGWFRIGCPTSQIAKPDVMGAIYRVRKSGSKSPSDPRGLKIAWGSLTPPGMAAFLEDPRFEVRDRAIAELGKAGPSAVPALRSALARGGSLESRENAIWALARIDGDDARRAVRAALTEAEPDLRQVAARVAGLHRDRDALAPLMEIVTSDEPPVRREAATALGRICNSTAVPALLAGLDSTTDRFLEHALIFALIQINDRSRTAKGLAMASSGTKRGALLALDQMDDGAITPYVVAPFLEQNDPVTEQTALWIIAHHGGWGREMTAFFHRLLARGATDAADRDELKRQLLAFSSDAAVQELIGTTLADLHTPLETRLLLLEVMGQAGIAKLPAAWIEPLRQALENGDERIVRQAVATMRAIPLDKRPLVSRIDSKIDFEETTKRFAGTRLSENFCARWVGTIRCPQDGTYTFYTESDDGSQLFVDGKLVVDNSGAHSMREKQGELRLTAGDHDLRVEFIQGEGEAGCKMAWAFDDHAKEIVPAGALWHRPRSAKATGASPLVPGLVGEFFELGGTIETFPNVAASEFDDALVRVALDSLRPIDVRVQSAAAVAPRLGGLDPELFGFLVSSLHAEQTPLIRLDAAEALGKGHLDDAQLKTLCRAVAAGGVLEVPKLLQAFEQSRDPLVGEALLAALARSPGLKSLRAETLLGAIEPFGAEVRQKAEPLLRQLSVDTQKQQARLAELQDVLAGGEIQRGRDLFFGNKKAICATCHAVQGQGGKFGPDLTKIGAIRTPRDLLEAIVFPSASFARGYEPFTVATDEGQVISGIIARETADAIYLFNNSRVEVRVPRSSIESLSQSTVSIMPEGMDIQLGPQELADLIAFLGSLR